MKNKFTQAICLFIFLFMASMAFPGCGAPKEGCGMDPSLDFNKVDSSKKPKKRKETSLFSKDHQKRMNKKRR